MVHITEMPYTVQEEAKAFPITVQNTFISIALGESSAPRRRCSSLPPMSSKACDRADSETLTDVCTESDELGSFSDSGQSDETESQDAIKVDEAKPQRTRLNASAAIWAPSVPIEMPPPPPPVITPPETGAMQLKLGTPKNKEWAKRWQSTVADLVAKMSLALGNAECVSMVECRQQRADWVVLARSKSHGLYQFERIQTIAKQAALEAAEASKNLYILGYRGLPFQATASGFSMTVGSMTNEKKACWDVYSKGFCPRGCSCSWEHPALVQSVTLMIDFTECEE